MSSKRFDESDLGLHGATFHYGAPLGPELNYVGRSSCSEDRHYFETSFGSVVDTQDPVGICTVLPKQYRYVILIRGTDRVVSWQFRTDNEAIRWIEQHGKDGDYAIAEVEI